MWTVTSKLTDPMGFCLQWAWWGGGKGGFVGGEVNRLDFFPVLFGRGGVSAVTWAVCAGKCEFSGFYVPDQYCITMSKLPKFSCLVTICAQSSLIGSFTKSSLRVKFNLKGVKNCHPGPCSINHDSSAMSMKRKSRRHRKEGSKDHWEKRTRKRHRQRLRMKKQEFVFTCGGVRPKACVFPLSCVGSLRVY